MRTGAHTAGLFNLLVAAASIAMLALACGPMGEEGWEEEVEPEAVDEAEVGAGLPAPTLEVPVAGDRKVTLRWSGGASGSSYQARFRAVGGDWRYRSVGRVNTYDVGDLVNGTKYEFQVRIKGSTLASTSSYSAVRSATPTASTTTPEPEPPPGGTTPVSDACDGTSVRHITVTGAGTRDGRTAANAGTMANLNDFISAVGPGGMVCVHAGTYGTGHSVSRGGTAAAPVTIKGVGGRPVFKSTFEAATLAKTGPTTFEVRASNLVFKNLEFSHVGSCFRFRAGLTVSNVTLSDFRAVNLATCVDIDRSSDATVSKLTVRNAMILQFTRGGIFLTSNTSGVLLEDLYIDMQPDRIGGRGSDYPVGIAFYNTVRDVVVRRATVMNVVGRMDGYTQGDGIDGETTAENILVENSYFRGSQDGCIDTKSKNMLIRNTTAVGCKRNYRLWQYISPGPRVENVKSYQPRNAHFFIKGGNTTTTNIAVYSDNAASLVAYDCTSTTPCKVTVAGITGTLLDSSKLNAASVSGSTLKYGADVSLPAIPNTTSFTP